MAYFDTKKGSLEEAIKAAVKNEKLDAVNKTAVKKKFDDRKDKDIDNDGDVDSSDKFLHKRRKAISKAIKSEENDILDESPAKVWHLANKKFSLISDKDGYTLVKQGSGEEKKLKAKTPADATDELVKKGYRESFEYGSPEATKNSLNMTPGQSSQEWDEQVGLMHKKHNTMREAIAKMWGVEEGHNPFKKEEVKTSKKEGKTMTGKSETKVTIGMKDK
jgi:hypothetical protein